MPRPTRGLWIAAAVIVVGSLASYVSHNWVPFLLAAVGALGYAWWFPTWSDDARLRRNRQ